MLLIAIPKSASTALMETVARTHRLKCDMHYRWQGPSAPGFEGFRLQHGPWTSELDVETAAHFVMSEVLYKVHIVPSENNRMLLRGRKKAILVREADGIISAYKRGHDTGVYKQKTDAFDGCVTEADWLTRAKELGIHGDMQRYRDLWIAADDASLIIHYEDMMRDPACEIARMEAYFGLPVSGTKELLKRKFTRAGEQSLEAHLATVESWKESEAG